MIPNRLITKVELTIEMEPHFEAPTSVQLRKLGIEHTVQRKQSPSGFIYETVELSMNNYLKYRQHAAI